jgi:hypothetical protein
MKKQIHFVSLMSLAAQLSTPLQKLAMAKFAIGLLTAVA